MTGRLWGAFAVVQLVGEVAFWSWERLPSPAIVWLWGVSLIALFPGNFLGALLIEKLLWNEGYSLAQLSAMEVPVEIIVNLVVWISCFKIAQQSWRRWVRRAAA